MIPKLRLLVTASLFAVWIGYLAYLVAVTRNPIILSRPQFLVADLYVLAELQGDPVHPSGKVLISEVVWPANPAAQQLVGKEIIVESLEECKKSNGWVGPRTYILPLTKITAPTPANVKIKLEDRYKLTEIPKSPGFDYYKQKLNYLLIYPATTAARHQLTALVEEFHPEK